MNRFTEILLAWYDTHKRALPWRDCGDPYRIWISEIILQQTRIAQGTDYYLRFVKRWPDVESLAAASEDDVLKMWEGLGYYSRARHLHQAAREIAATGGFPEDYKSVRALKGIGDYTAAAICSMAYGLPYAAIDGNAYRVMGRVFAVEEPIDTGSGKKYFSNLARELLDACQPGKYNQAMMDFGAMQCIPHHPDCTACPFAEMCAAHAGKCEEDYPRKARRLQPQERFFTYVYVIIRNQGIIFHKRSGKDIWRGLYEPYLVEKTSAEWENDAWIASLLQERGARLIPLRQQVKHVLTHRIIRADFYQISLEKVPHLPEGYEIVPFPALDNLALPRLIQLNLPGSLD